MAPHDPVSDAMVNESESEQRRPEEIDNGAARRRKGLRGTMNRRQLMAGTLGATALGTFTSSDAEARANARNGSFGSGDLSLLQAVMGSVPHLLPVATAVKAVRYTGASYPIT